MLHLSCRKFKISTHSQRVVVSPFRAVNGIVNSLKREKVYTNLEAIWHSKGKNLHVPTIFISLLLSPRTMYCDETADECSGINVHQPTAFAHKLLQLSGVSFFWDEFPASTKSSPVCSATQLVKLNAIRKMSRDEGWNVMLCLYIRFILEDIEIKLLLESVLSDFHNLFC